MNASADPTAGMSDAEIVAYYEVHGTKDFARGEVVDKPYRGKHLDAVVSVRFSPEQLEQVERQAAAAGVKLTTYIRMCAISGEVKVPELLARVEQLHEDIVHLAS